MPENSKKIIQLHDKLETLLKKQASFQGELDNLRKEIEFLKLSDIADNSVDQQANIIPEPSLPRQEKNATSSSTEIKKPKIKSDIEKFIGENLINKIGIVFTIIGVGIGAKYAIDHDLISPWTRIILGYLVGLALFGFAIRLKKQFENFSAVLLSGSMAIMYFITFAAYNFYGLIPLPLTFVLMALFTWFTVAAAITYNNQVIAHIGLVGAYAVPFLLGDDSGKIVILFSYMALINVGILIISFRKYWKPLYYSSFIITWLIMLTWYIPKYQTDEHFGIAMTFISIFFTTFYLIFLAYKLLKKEKFEIEDILLLLANSAIFYGLGYSILRAHQTGEEFLGTFTLANALIHSIVGAVIYRQKMADKNLFYFVVGLALVYITIAIPVQFDGKWVTLLWAGEVAVLFWIGRTKNIAVYESLSYPLMFLVLCSLIHDWLTVYNIYYPGNPESRIIPLFNINFLTSLLFISSFTFINVLNNHRKYVSPISVNKILTGIMNFSMPAILIIAVYFSFVMEISTFWNQLYIDSVRTVNKDLTVPQHFWNEDLLKYNTISIINYSLLFLAVLSFVNILKIKNSLLGIINLVLNAFALVLFLTAGLFVIGELRGSYLSQAMSEFYFRGNLNIGIRYISFIFIGLMLFSIYKYIREQFLSIDLKIEFDFLLHITILTIAANELINWMDLFRSEQSYKLGLSILFGVYALLLTALGIWKKKKHLRIGAIVLFGATLVKLFFYDLAYLDTISKTIVFVSLGVLLLIISFLYNKYKHTINQ
ncbi:MAG: DUF2339 domain-containing protein [Bacteroidota bacterium]